MPDRDSMTPSLRRIDKDLDILSQTMTKLYQTTYSSRVDDRRNVDKVFGDIDDSLDNILSQVNGQSLSNISNLYLRLQDKKVSKTEVEEAIESLFDQSGALLDTINVDNIRRSIQSEDYQYDLICKYMTKLEDALDIKKDNVLSSDNFTKDFINVTSGRSGKDFINQFNDRATLIKDKYDVQELYDDMYYKASKYGEYFLYKVPYKRAFEKLLKRKDSYANGVKFESAMIFEAASFEDKNGDLSKDFLDCIKEGEMKVEIVFEDFGIVPEAIEAVSESAKIRDKYISLTESFYVDSKSGAVAEVTGSDLRFDNPLQTNDGLMVANRKNERNYKITSDATGTVLYEIPRDEIIPVYMDKFPIGYIYIRVANNYVNTIISGGGTYNSLVNNTKLAADQIDRQNDILISQIAIAMANKIDAKFINANLDLKEQIYAVLRYNDKFCATQGTNTITVSFLPVEDVHHFYFRMNDVTHRGISDLEKSMVPGMVYCMLYLNNAIGTVSRAQDKRVYYVKQNVEQNVARTLLNVIDQLKRGNMGMRQLESMNTIFNVIGKYNDHIIPMGQNGDPPIQMEVLQGQDQDTPTDLMDRMEDAAVSATDVPLEFVQSVQQVDYASRFTMSNSKFLRKVYKRQRICQKHFTEIFRDLYNFEYNENDVSLKILLPAPAYLAMTNTSQLIENIKTYVEAISAIVVPDSEDDAVKQEFTNICVRNHLGTYIDFSAMDDMLTEARLNVAARTNPNDMGSDYSDMGGDEEEEY